MSKKEKAGFEGRTKLLERCRKAVAALDEMAVSAELLGMPVLARGLPFASREISNALEHQVRALKAPGLFDQDEESRR